MPMREGAQHAGEAVGAGPSERGEGDGDDEQCGTVERRARRRCHAPAHHGAALAGYIGKTRVPNGACRVMLGKASLRGNWRHRDVVAAESAQPAAQARARVVTSRRPTVV